LIYIIAPMLPNKSRSAPRNDRHVALLRFEMREPGLTLRGRDAPADPGWMIVDKPVDYLCINSLGPAHFRLTKALFYREFSLWDEWGRVRVECLDK
jgi:hypothetical protein